MNGKIPAIALISTLVIGGAGMWYTQVYAFYDRIPADSERALVAITGDMGRDVLPVQNFEGIDSDSSPIRYRACFTTDPSSFPQDAVPFENPTPLIGPGWFDCFDANAIGADLEAGQASAYLSHAEISPDVDRVIAIYPDGRGYAWHQFNDKSPERGVMD